MHHRVGALVDQLGVDAVFGDTGTSWRLPKGERFARAGVLPSSLSMNFLIMS
jgi:hypothetical protein